MLPLQLVLVALLLPLLVLELHLELRVLMLVLLLLVLRSLALSARCNCCCCRSANRCSGWLLLSPSSPVQQSQPLLYDKLLMRWPEPLPAALQQLLPQFLFPLLDPSL